MFHSNAIFDLTSTMIIVILIHSLINFVCGTTQSVAETSNAVKHTKNELRLPNGTVIGRYAYVDNEGNNVYVRYFADDVSYGVELQRLKFTPGPKPQQDSSAGLGTATKSAKKNKKNYVENKNDFDDIMLPRLRVKRDSAMRDFGVTQNNQRKKRARKSYNQSRRLF